MNKGNGIFVCSIQGSEKFFEANPSEKDWSSNSVKSEVQSIVSKSGMTTSRKNPETINITVESLATKDGKITRSTYRTFTIQIPIAPMTKAEFETEWDALLAILPKEFQSAVAALVYGTADGYESRMEGLLNCVQLLTPAIEAHTKRCAYNG